MKTRILMIVISGLFLCLVAPDTITAQSGTEAINLAVQVDDEKQINLYTVDAAGHFTFLQTLPGFYIYNTAPNYSNTWELPRGSEIAPSPDRTQLAFTVMDPRTRETALLLYQIGQTEFQTIPTPGLGQVIWSPDGSQFLLTPPDTYYGGNFTPLHDTYVYDTVSGSLDLLLTSKYSFATGYEWLPDGSRIVYVGSSEGCHNTSPCLSVSNLYSIDPQGQHNHQLTNLATLTAEDLGLPPVNFYPCRPINPTWSALNERIYFSLDCGDAVSMTFSSLHSVTLDGEHRLEGRMTDFFQNAIGAYIIDFHPSATSHVVYISAGGTVRVSRDDLTYLQGSWRVLKTTTPGSMIEIVSETLDDFPPFSVSALSPDDNHLALAGVSIAILNLNTGQFTTYQTDQSICDVEWIDTQTIRYHQFETPCSDSYRIPTGTWQLNITTGNPVEITADLPGTVWVLPNAGSIPGR